MSASQEVVQYGGDGAVQVMLPDGSQCNGVVALWFTPAAGSTAMTEDIIGAVQQAIVAAFPSSWGVTNADIPIVKTDQTTVTYTTDYTSTPLTFT